MILFCVFKFNRYLKKWMMVKRFGKEKCAENYIGLVSKGTDDLYCIEAREFARSDYAGVV